MNSKCMLALFVLGLACRSTTAITCYQCSTTIGVDNTEKNTDSQATNVPGCADASSVTTSNDLDFACMTTYTENGDTITIERKVSPMVASKTHAYCTSTAESTTCYCSTSNCNSEKIAAVRSYECYVCQSSHYFDNGCGEKLTTGTYVPTAKGCSACYKTVSLDGDASVTYTRGCTRSTNIDDGCVDGYDQSGNRRQCGCKGNLCNSAEGLKSASIVASIVLSVAAKIFSS